MRTRLAAWFSFMAFAPAIAMAQAPVQYSGDVTLQLGANLGQDQDYFLGSPAATAAVALSGLPARTDMDALHIDDNFDVLFSLDTGATVAGVYAQAGDVVLRHGPDYTLAFDASANGIAAGANCDAVARSASALLLLSFDMGFSVGGMYVRAADVVSFNGASFSKVIDAQALGLPQRLNIDALQALSATSFLVSFDTGGSVGGVVFGDEDILQLDLAGPSWSMRHAMLGTSSRWGPANLDALAAAAVGDGLFKNQFE